MQIFTHESDVRLARPLDEVFPFFAEAQNLERLTPPWLQFQVLSPQPVEMRVGAVIDYRLRVHGIPLRWRSEIVCWEPPHRFIDEQTRGPYRRWVHEHRFHEEDGAVVASDRVEYAVPGGALVNWLFVKRDMERIFAYRRAKLQRLFGQPSGS